jgi:DNA-binding LacI/PurR family transcriptional regulator
MVHRQNKANTEPATRSGTPMAEGMADRIARWLSGEGYVAGQPIPSERELSQRLSASRQLVRASLDLLCARGIIDRKPNCRPIYSARPVVRERPSSGRQTVALWLIQEPGNAERAAILHGIQSAIDPDAFRLIVESPIFLSTEEVVAGEQRFIERLAEECDITGALLWCMGGETSLRALKVARDHGVPFVFIDREPPSGFDADFVGVDNFESARQATRHLIDQGHERIAHITNSEEVSTVHDRRKGYRAALDGAGIEFREDFQIAFKGSLFNVDAESVEIVTELLSRPDPPTAAFVVNDLYALGILRALDTMGINVPEEMAIVGFDGAEFLRPSPKTLTTAVQPFERIGARAVDLLLRRFQDGNSAPYRHVLLEAPLSVQRSSRPSKRSEPSS